MKVGFTAREGGFLTSEYEAMHDVRPLLPGQLQGSMPRALDLVRDGEVTVISVEVVEGRRLLVPRLTGEVSAAAVRVMDSFFARSFAFSNEMAVATSSETASDQSALVEVVDRFIESFAQDHPETGDRASEFAGALAGSGVSWHAAWQHQDIAVGNVLEDDGRLMVLDWEHAGPGSFPWFDIAYTPVATAHLAWRVDRLPSIKTAALATLDEATPIGSALHQRMNEIWDHQIPMSWAVTLAAMEGALRRLDDGREASPEYAELVGVILCDEEFHERVGWLTPRW
jgi:aminoglycoside phosphotransferase (APT) family kinase protein